MNTKEEIKNSVKKAILTLYPTFRTFEKLSIGVSIDRPKEIGYGDYSTNAALILATLRHGSKQEKMKKTPMEIAKEIKGKLEHSGILQNIGISKIEVASPGFINFFLKGEIFIENIKEILKKQEKFGGKATPLFGAKKVVVEYTDPNILKEFHIGHLMSNTIGEAISRIIEFQGAKVKRLCYQGDVGLHVAKAIFGKVKNPDYDWQSAYVFGSQKYEETETAKKEIVDINKKVFEQSDEQINKLYKQGKEESLKNFNVIYKKLGTKFDYLFFESETAEFGKKIVESGLAKGIFEKGDKGAIVFKGEHTRVFINSEGLPTYEAKELGLAKIKYDKFKYDKSIIVTANEQNSFFKVVLEAMSQIFPSLAKKTRQIGHGIMRLPEGKMASRKGNVITAESFINEVEQKIKNKIGGRQLSNGDLEKIAIGAIKYSILKQSIGKDIIYDFEKSISFEGDSGPYLQYAYVRAKSVLEKAQSERLKIDTNLRMTPEFTNVEISRLEKLMIYFAEVVEKAGENSQPHYITSYLTELAREFNHYYEKNKILDKNDPLSPYKVALAEAFSIIMKSGLWLLSIPPPNKM